MKQYIDQDAIYKETNEGLDVFLHFFPEVDYNNPKHFFKERDNEKTASAKLSFFKGKWRITDFGNQGEVNSLSAVAYVMYRESLIYIDALRYIEEVIIRHSVGSDGFKRPEYKAEYRMREVGPDDVKGKYNFIYKEKPSKFDLDSIGRYITPELLEKFHFKTVEQYEFVGFSKKEKRDVVHIFRSTDDYPIFVIEEQDFKKLYKPNEPEKKYRFHYIGEKPSNYIFGLEQLENADNEFEEVDDKGEMVNTYKGPDYKTPHLKDVIRCSGESDALNLASIGYHVYWLNSESANFDADDYAMIDNMCENHYQLMDLDATGRKNALDLAQKHMNLFTIELPDWLQFKNDWRGNRCKDGKDFVNLAGRNQDETISQFAVLKRRAFAMKFWEKNIEEVKGKKKVNYNINLENFYYFLQCQGFYVTDSEYHSKAGYCYARVNGKVVDLIHPDEIKKIAKRFTKNWIRSRNLLDEVAILNKINASNQISENNLQELKEIDLNFRNHKLGVEYLHFRNGSLRITPDKVEKIKHHEVPNYILGSIKIKNETISHLIDRNIRLIKKDKKFTSPIEINPTPEFAELLTKLKNAKSTHEREDINVEIANFPDLDRYQVTINDEEFIWVRFLKDLCHLHWRKELEDKKELTEEEKKEQDLLLANLMFVFGYMTSQYKNPGKPWLVFMQDYKISAIGQSSGRSGKSLFTLGMGHVRPSFYVGGRRKDITEKTEFIYDGFTRFHNFIEIDDLYEFAEFNFFYTQVTGKREVNSKHISKQILGYDESGKMIISSNFELQNTDNSTIARILNATVSDYYHEKTKYNDYRETRSPLSKFGKMLFDQFDDEEWNKYYNWSAYCMQLQMRFDKIQPPMANLQKRQLRREMLKGVTKNEEFFHWANVYFETPPKEFKRDEDICPEEQGYFNSYVKRENAWEHFKAKSGLNDLHTKKYSSSQFKKSLASWCEYYGYELNPIQKCTGKNADVQRRIMKTVDKQTAEYLYISTAPGNYESDDLTPDESNDLPF